MGWWKTAKPGDKVVYLRDFEKSRWGHLASRGCVYTVKDVLPSARWSEPLRPKISAGVAVQLVEDDAWYDAARFRPVQTKSTDTGMAILKRILERPHQRIEEDA